jgi:cytidine deaminase
MKKVKFNDLSKQQQSLVNAALAVMKHAYAPYSKYLVGASVLTDQGNIYAGCNVERVTYSQTTHAERNAVDTMISNAERKIEALCCVSLDGAIPCAECRQGIWEFCGNDPNITILASDTEKNITITTMGEIYPYPFGPNNLNIDPKDF